MGDSDFGFLMFAALTMVLWGAFNMMYANNELVEQNILNSEKQDVGIMATILALTEFLNPLSDNFKSEILMLNIFVFPILLFGTLLCSVRFARGI